MASAWPDLWSLPLPADGPADRSGLLLRLQAELFVGAQTRDRETIRTFEAMALGFIPRLDMTALAALADILAPCEDTPETVLIGLAQRSSAVLATVAAKAPRLPPEIADLLLGAESDRPKLAARPDLDSRTLARLLVVGEDGVDEALAANPSLSPGDAAFSALVERARRRPALARTLLARGDIPLADEAALYLHADQDQRASIRHRVAASAVYRRPRNPPRLTASEVERLLVLARDGEVEALEGRLTAALGLPGDTEWHLLATGRHELLALSLQALGMHEEDAARVFLTLHPAIAHSVTEVFALVRIVRQVARSTALALLEAILGSASRTERQGRHLPALDPSGTPARPGILPQDQARPLREEHRKAG